jgi:hypothetical protein
MEIIDMTSRKFLFVFSIMAILAVACSSSPTSEPNEILDPLPCGEEVEWDLAVEILNQGNVEQVTQLHSLEVTLILEDGCEIKTIEPSIDDIFDEVQKCGEECEGMILATE